MDQQIKKAIQDQARKVSFPEHVDIEKSLSRKKKKKKKMKLQWAIIPLLLVVCFFASWKMTSTIASLFETEPVKHVYDEYLIYNEHYYVLTDEVVAKKKIGQELGEVKRTGEWAYLEEGDTNMFTQETKYYEVKGEKNKIAIEMIHNGAGYPEFRILQKQKPIEAVDEKKMFGAKNDSKGVQKSLKNVRKVVPFLYEITDAQLKPSFVKLSNDKKHYYVKLMYVPHINNPDHPKVIFVREYEKNYVDPYVSDMSLDGDFWFDKKDKVNQFVVSDMKWTEYRSKREKEYVTVFRAEKNNVIYEVSSQLYTAEEVKKFLGTMKGRGETR
ncbi:hypothetical protein [Bacillus mycoides]|uniref:hypothetical protein n=1 Tax=Bacillus mycoides TaxID=1405 RepID=UPI0011AAE628|nr:hypothetical protein [Bacillus mycoides]